MKWKTTECCSFLIKGDVLVLCNWPLIFSVITSLHILKEGKLKEIQHLFPGSPFLTLPPQK